MATRPIFGAEPRELSLLFVLFYIAASGDEQNAGTFERNFNTRDGAQMCRFVGGTQLICAEDGQPARRRASCCAPGAADRAGRRRRHRPLRALEVQAKRVIVAIPPTARRAHRVHARAARSPATSSPSGCRRAR